MLWPVIQGAGDRRDDRRATADLRRGLDAAAEQAADDELVDEVVADLQFAARRLLRHARRRAGAAGRTVDRLLAVEDGVAGMRLRVMRPARPQDVAEAA